MYLRPKYCIQCIIETLLFENPVIINIVKIRRNI